MNEGRLTSDPAEDGQRSWIDRLGDALLREPTDRQQLIHLLRDAEQRHLLDADALAMIEGVLEVSQMQVRDIMVPRKQMVTVDRTDSPETFLPVLIESAHSRFPVIGDNKDEVVGILLAKDMLAYFVRQEKEGFDLRELLRPVVFIPESKRLNVLLKEFRASRNHMAVVVDEYGGVAGLVTIEDVLEQIVGEIEDEHDVDEDIAIFKSNDGSYTIKAFTEIEEFNEFFGSHLGDDDFDTVGGYVVNQFGHMPKRDEQVLIDDRFLFTVLRADKRQVHLLRMAVIETAVSPDADQTTSASRMSDSQGAAN
jgi:magnesium and cobalt transporter